MQWIAQIALNLEKEVMIQNIFFYCAFIQNHGLYLSCPECCVCLTTVTTHAGHKPHCLTCNQGHLFATVVKEKLHCLTII